VTFFCFVLISKLTNMKEIQENGVRKMAIYKYKCLDCGQKFQLEVTKNMPPAIICPKCKSEEFKADYEQPEIEPKFPKDNIRCFCALK